MSKKNRKNRRVKNRRKTPRLQKTSSIDWIRDGAVIPVPGEDLGRLMVAAHGVDCGQVSVIRSSAGKIVRTDIGDVQLNDCPELRMLDLANSIGVSPAAALRLGSLGTFVSDDRLVDLVVRDEDGVITHLYDVVVQAAASFSWKTVEENEDVLAESFFAQLKALQEAVP